MSFCCQHYCLFRPWLLLCTAFFDSYTWSHQALLAVQGEHAQLSLHVFDIELLLDLLRKPAYKAQQVFEKLVAGNMVTGVQVGLDYIACLPVLAPQNAYTSSHHLHPQRLHTLCPLRPVSMNWTQGWNWCNRWLQCLSGGNCSMCWLTPCLSSGQQPLEAPSLIPQPSIDSGAFPNPKLPSLITSPPTTLHQQSPQPQMLQQTSRPPHRHSQLLLLLYLTFPLSCCQSPA